MKLLLASQSPYRRQQMKDFGLDFESYSPKMDEDQLKKTLHLNPEKLALHLAEAKALSLRSSHPHDLIIGSDQLLALGSKVLGKPGTRTKAIQQLKLCQGRTVRLITAVSLSSPKKTLSSHVVAKIKMRKLRQDEILAYVYRDRPYDCAGAFRFEASGFGLVDKISVCDPSSLLGLPMLNLCQLFRKLREPIPYKSPSKSLTTPLAKNETASAHKGI